LGANLCFILLADFLRTLLAVLQIRFNLVPVPQVETNDSHQRDSRRGIDRQFPQRLCLD
jgi:hypothetical protein